MKKTSLTRALFVAGVLAAAGSLAQADAIFYPDGTKVELGASGVESGWADAVLARSPSTAPDSTVLASMGLTIDQNAPILASSDDEFGTTVASSDTSLDTRTLGAGSSGMQDRKTVTTTVTTAPVYVFPNINWDRATVLSQPHPMMRNLREQDRVAAESFNSPRAGEVRTVTSSVPTLVTDNNAIVSQGLPPNPDAPDTTALGAGSSSLTCSGALDCAYPGE